LKLNRTLGLRSATRLAKPRRTPKKNAPCFLGFARARFSFQKGKGVFSSVFCPQGFGQVAELLHFLAGVGFPQKHN